MFKITFTCFVLFFAIFLGFANEEPIPIKISYLEDSKHILEINDVLNLKFIKLEDKNKLNFGFTKSNVWVKLNLEKLIPHSKYKILLNTIINDSIEVYKKEFNTFEKTFLGEAFPSKGRYPFLSFEPESEDCIIYFKIIGRDHPLSFPFEISKFEEIENSELNNSISIGIVYGIVFLILLLNFILYINTLERIYIYSMFFNLFSLGVLFYFDGIIKLYFFPNSLYWNNQSISIAFCGSFIFTNHYIVELLNLRRHKKLLCVFFEIVNYTFLFILVLSFWHPTGFNWYLKSNLILTTIEVILLSYCIFYIRKKEKNYFNIQLISVISLNVFGTISQLYFSGILPINFVTVHSVHFVIVPQIFIQAFALGKRLSIMMKQETLMSKSLQESAEEYSRSLINTIEEERRRLSKEFHDGIGQNLLVIRNSILKIKKEELQPKQLQKLDEISHIASDILDEVRLISQNLRPSTLDSLGLTASIKSMINKLNEVSETVFILNCPQSIDDIINKDVEINMYRIIQEITNNVIKHAKAKSVLIDIIMKKDSITINSIDDGIGFDLNSKNRELPKNGLSGMKERVAILKGELNISSVINKGTITKISIPF